MVIKTVIFDLGGVIITLDQSQAIQRFKDLGLADAEKRLARVGFNRAPGETVSVFAKRIEQALNAMHANALATKKASPKDSHYEKEISFALGLLREYENNRWRKSYFTNV